MKTIKKIWREVSLVLTLAAFVILMYLWVVERPEGIYRQSFMLIAIVASAAVSVLLLRSLWRDKWRRVATAAMQRVFAGLQRAIERVADRLGIRRSKKSVLSGKTTVIFHKMDEKAESVTARVQKPPKWKHLSDERARMRYLYRQLVSDKIKKGERIYSSSTPSEIKEGRERTELEGELFDMYISLRYDERKFPDPDDVARLKKELEIK